MVVIDTDVLLLAFAFQSDVRQADNALFLQKAQTAVPAVTIYTLMEFLGKLSFNLSPERLEQWQSWLVAAYQLEVVWPVAPTTSISYLSWHELMFSRPFNRMKTVQMPYTDALILDLTEQVQADSFVTWNARHFRNKTSVPVWTPEEFLANA